MLAHESLYVGVDIGKLQHVAGFVSTTLLVRHAQFEGCPILKFENSREGFRSFVDCIQVYVPLEQCFVLMEHTGHYHKVLEQYLQELDLSVYLMHVRERPHGIIKTDKRDALGLANHLYNQLEKGIQVVNKLDLVRRAVAPSEPAAALRGIIRHRQELVQEVAQRKNKLTSICDELFPELPRVFRDPNRPTALVYRQHFPTPHLLAAAPLSALQALRGKNYPSNVQLVALQALAAQSIGTKDVHRQRGLVIEQRQVITEVVLMQQHIDDLNHEIQATITQSRQGQIILSIPGFGPIQAATLLAAIGHIDNFATAAAFKAYCGWAPTVAQSGTTLDRASQYKGGVRAIKGMMFLVVGFAIQQDGPWKALYERLVPRKCVYDERTRAYKGKLKVFGRIAGQMLTVVYALLKYDQEAVQRTPPGEAPPAPMLYDPVVHQQHRTGQYRPLKPKRRPATVILSPK